MYLGNYLKDFDETNSVTAPWQVCTISIFSQHIEAWQTTSSYSNLDFDYPSKFTVYHHLSSFSSIPLLSLSVNNRGNLRHDAHVRGCHALSRLIPPPTLKKNPFAVMSGRHSCTWNGLPYDCKVREWQTLGRGRGRWVVVRTAHELVRGTFEIWEEKKGNRTIRACKFRLFFLLSLFLRRR